MKVREATIEIYWKTYTLAAFHERGSGRLLSSLKCICEPSCHKKIHQGEHIQDRYQNLQKILTPGEEFVSWYESWRGTVGDDPHAQRQMSICGKIIWKRLSQIQEQSYERMSLGFFCFIWHGAPQVRSLDIVIFSKHEWNCCIKCCCLFLLSKNPPVFVFLPRSWTDFPWPFFYSTYLHWELMIIRECSLCRNSDKNWQN